MSAADTNDFFKTQRTTSDIKSEILNDFFRAWCSTILQGQRYRTTHALAFIDLYAGEGVTASGKPATPVKILNSIFGSADKPSLNKIVRTFFNDEKPAVAAKLKQHLQRLPYYDELVNQPVMLNEEANLTKLVKVLSNETPTLLITDPFGYEFSQQMLLQASKRWGSDILMLFTPTKLRAAMQQLQTSDLLLELFGAARVAKVLAFQERYQDAGQREDFVVDLLEEVFKEKDYKTFRFKISLPRKNQTSHYLFFVSKTDAAYMKLKELMLVYSDFQEDGVPLFGANIKHQLSLFQEQYRFSIVNLAVDLAAKGSYYNNLPLDSIYRHHNMGTNYIRGNYVEAFEELKKRGVVEAINPVTRKPVRKISFTTLMSYTGAGISPIATF